MMGIEVVVQIRKPPEVPGYNDTITIIEDNHFVYMCPASGGPNHRAPRNAGAGPWQSRYGRIAPGIYSYQAVDHKRYGLSLLVAGGGRVPSRTPNPRHDGEQYLDQIFVHCGWRDYWRGSAGCPVIHPTFWRGFQFFFRRGDRGSISIVDVP